MGQKQAKAKKTAKETAKETPSSTTNSTIPFPPSSSSSEVSPDGPSQGNFQKAQFNVTNQDLQEFFKKKASPSSTTSSSQVKSHPSEAKPIPNPPTAKALPTSQKSTTSKPTSAGPPKSTTTEKAPAKLTLPLPDQNSTSSFPFASSKVSPPPKTTSALPPKTVSSSSLSSSSSHAAPKPPPPNPPSLNPPKIQANDKAKLVLFGPSCSGKTTFLQQFFVPGDEEAKKKFFTSTAHGGTVWDQYTCNLDVVNDLNFVLRLSLDVYELGETFFKHSENLQDVTDGCKDLLENPDTFFVFFRSTSESASSSSASASWPAKLRDTLPSDRCIDVATAWNKDPVGTPSSVLTLNLQAGKCDATTWVHEKLWPTTYKLRFDTEVSNPKLLTRGFAGGLHSWTHAHQAFKELVIERIVGPRAHMYTKAKRQFAMMEAFQPDITLITDEDMRQLAVPIGIKNYVLAYMEACNVSGCGQRGGLEGEDHEDGCEPVTITVVSFEHTPNTPK